MRVNVLIPVFNRLEHTRRVIAALRAQTVFDNIRIVIIDDGSTDGTAEFLAAQPDVTSISTDGNRWWGGAMDVGLKQILPDCSPEDYILFVNNDTWFGPTYVETLIRCSRENGDAIVGSVVHEEDSNPPLTGVGPRLNINRIAVWDILAELSDEERRNPKPLYKADALSGRGTLFPAELFKRHGTMRPHLLPHYMADYEVSMRFARAGAPLLVSSEAIVYSPSVYGAHVSNISSWKKHFGRRSPHNVFQRIAFYSLIGTPLQRLTAPLRMAAFMLIRTISVLRAKK
ncbi:glycosyltransferase family 2 protein [Rhizobium bangladeshense]|uniref:glycosyltransferase family 2 protein n=1 Tax=Rhizobium bangladeshense TaxID=1138189 RepID=UPI001C90A98C|nr:glycosyltransferase family 2 protein [Rhizobium bangladeshense]MBY3596246.1 glycosyltransferase family 2 protein [Rhizobium bangladeshense]